MIEEKQKHRRSIPELEIDIHGYLIHIGKVSYGCKFCFDNKGLGLDIGNKCMCSCPMCYFNPNRNDNGHQEHVSYLLNEFTKVYHQNVIFHNIAYRSSGETLIYIDDLERFAKLFKKFEEKHNIEIYYHIYTNGILADKEMLKKLKDIGIDEIRFHISASGFSKKVIKNMYEASKMNFVVTVEEPSWPKNKDDLIRFLPIFEDIGLKHLNMDEVIITPWNIDNVRKEYNQTIGIYKDYYCHLYDGGMVYDIMKEVIKKGYSYSVLDCNSGIEKYKNSMMYNVFDDSDTYNSCFNEIRS